MVMEAMINNSADGIAMLEAHEDAEVVRLRLGKALDFEYSEDSFAGLFQRRDPREAGPILDIERALSKLEKVCSPFESVHRWRQAHLWRLVVTGRDSIPEEARTAYRTRDTECSLY